MSNQRITPPAGSRIGMSDMNQEFTGAWNRRTGMAEAGTWVGLPAGTRHGFDSYWGKSNKVLVATLSVQHDTSSGGRGIPSNQTYMLPLFYSSQPAVNFRNTGGSYAEVLGLDGNLHRVSATARVAIRQFQESPFVWSSYISVDGIDVSKCYSSNQAGSMTSSFTANFYQ